MILPVAPAVYDPQDESATRQALEQELDRVNAQLQAIRDALKANTALPITVRT